ncbi:hypothetical protein Agub_g800, partial [Astrephomene gubernaculifera]
MLDHMENSSSPRNDDVSEDLDLLDMLNKDDGIHSQLLLARLQARNPRNTVSASSAGPYCGNASSHQVFPGCSSLPVSPGRNQSSNGRSSGAAGLRGSVSLQVCHPQQHAGSILDRPHGNHNEVALRAIVRALQAKLEAVQPTGGGGAGVGAGSPRGRRAAAAAAAAAGPAGITQAGCASPRLARAGSAGRALPGCGCRPRTRPGACCSRCARIAASAAAAPAAAAAAAP